MTQSVLKKVNHFSLSTILLYLGGWFIVAFGQPARSPQLGIIAAACGFALFWMSVRHVDRKQRFWISASWFFCVQLIQLSWFTSIEYQGYYILCVYVCLCLFLALQFGLITDFFFAQSPIGMMRILACASMWTLMEWSRLFVICGFSWNPIGIALSSTLYSMQLSSVWGIYGLTFWVFLVNASAYRIADSGRKWTSAFLWIVLAAFPYFFGSIYVQYHSPKETSGQTLSLALVQTGLLPSQKVPLPDRWDDFIAPIDQWKNILTLLKEEKAEKWDLIVLPEAVVPLRADYCFYSYAQVVHELVEIFGTEVLQKLPPLGAPFAENRWMKKGWAWCVSNAFWVQFIANFYQAEVLVGLDHQDFATDRNFNSAFYFKPGQQKLYRYDKQVLLPLAEYLPMQWLKTLTKSYGITDFFSHGNETKIFGDKISFSPSICYEETFPDRMRDGRVQGAELFINVTNDNYYPFSKLPEQHFSHARLRAVENGVPLIRACNTGVTAVVDHLGRTIGRLGEKMDNPEMFKGVLNLSFVPKSHRTLYTLWGDAGVIGFSLGILLIYFRGTRKKFLKSLQRHF